MVLIPGRPKSSCGLEEGAKGKQVRVDHGVGCGVVWLGVVRCGVVVMVGGVRWGVVG